MYMTEAEICRDYRLTADTHKPKQIGILADMNLCRRSQIAGILERHGESIIQKRAMPTRAEIDRRKELRLTMYRQGMTDSEISAALGESYCTTYYWRRGHGLPPNKRRTKNG